MLLIKRLAETFLVLFVILFVVVCTVPLVVGGAIAGGAQGKATLKQRTLTPAPKSEARLVPHSHIIMAPSYFLGALTTSGLASFAISFSGILPWCRRNAIPSRLH